MGGGRAERVREGFALQLSEWKKLDMDEGIRDGGGNYGGKRKWLYKGKEGSLELPLTWRIWYKGDAVVDEGEGLKKKGEGVEGRS